MPRYQFSLFLAVVLLIIAGMTADVALGCAVCGAVSDKARVAYIQTTALMSLVPLGLIGGIAYWIYRTSSAPDSRGE